MLDLSYAQWSAPSTPIALANGDEARPTNLFSRSDAYVSGQISSDMRVTRAEFLKRLQPGHAADRIVPELPSHFLKMTSIHNISQIRHKTVIKKNMSTQEFELKIAMSKEAMDRFRRRPVMRKLGSGPARRQKLRATYFDTLGLDLHNKGIALRVRREGRKWVQTLKLEAAIEQGLSRSTEIECVVRGPRPNLDCIADEALRERLGLLIDGEAIVPVFETDVWRTTREVEISDAGTVELALDQGEIRAGDRVVPVCEVEVELKTGRPYAVLSAAEELFKGEPVRPSGASKADTGYALVKGTFDASVVHKPKTAKKPALNRWMSSAQALTAVGRSASDQILQNWLAVQTNEDPEGPHQIRVGLRRMRTALKLLKPAINSPELLNISKDARDLARIVGRLRDADVLLDEIYLPAATALDGGTGYDDVHDVLMKDRDRARSSVRRSLNDAKWSRLKLHCIFFEHLVSRIEPTSVGDEAGAGILEISRKALSKSWKRVRGHARHLDSLSIEERHEMRKALKTLRYATEFFLPLYSSPDAEKFLKQLKRLQDVFGYLNDVAMAERVTALLARSATADAETFASAHTILEWHQERAEHAWLDARERWTNLSEVPRFWK